MRIVTYDIQKKAQQITASITPIFKTVLENISFSEVFDFMGTFPEGTKCDLLYVEGKCRAFSILELFQVKDARMAFLHLVMVHKKYRYQGMTYQLIEHADKNHCYDEDYILFKTRSPWIVRVMQKYYGFGNVYPFCMSYFELPEKVQQICTDFFPDQNNFITISPSIATELNHQTCDPELDRYFRQLLPEESYIVIVMR